MKKRTLLAAAFLTAFLCACSNSEQHADTTPQEDERTQTQMLDDSTDWVARGTVLPINPYSDDAMAPEGGWATEYLCTLSEGSVYRYVASKTGVKEEDEYDTGYFIIKIEPPYEDILILDSIGLNEWVEGDSCRSWVYPWAKVATENGQLFTLLQGEENVYLGWWKEIGTYTAEKIEKNFLQEGGDDANDVQFMYVDAVQDKVSLNYSLDIYLADSRGILRGGVNQDLQRISRVDGTVLHIGKNEFQGQLYHSGYTADAGFYVQSLESERPDFTTDAVNMMSGDQVVWCSETEGYLCTRDAVWKFSLDKQEINRIIQLSYQGSTPDRLLSAEVGEDGTVRLLVVFVGGVIDQYVLLEVSQDTGKNDKIVLELATYSASDYLKQAVYRFNESNSEYYVEIREAGSGIEYADFNTRIQAELSAGNGPDLLPRSTFANNRIDQMADKKLLLELTEFFREEEEEMLPNVWSSGKVEESLYAVPYAFSVQTLVTNKSVVGERTGWNVEELMQCVRESGVQQFSSAVNDVLLFCYLCGIYGDDSDIIDWENRTCHFNSEKTEELLRFTKEYSGETDYMMTDIKVLEGNAFVDQVYLYGPEFLYYNICVHQNGQVFIGYPTVSGESGHILDASMVGINQNTEHVEGALAFLKYLISEDMQEYVAECMGRGNSIITEFPVSQLALEHLYEYLLNVPTGEDEDEDKIFYEYPSGPIQTIDGQYSFPILPFTEDNIQQLRTVLETAKPRPVHSSEIINIIDEETGAYFSGNKEADKVLDAIQNRVQLYLDEMN